MNISEINLTKLKEIIKELYELSWVLPDISKNVLSTNISYRAYILEEWSKDFSQDINWDLKDSEDK